jgi:hypothetical protein
MPVRIFPHDPLNFVDESVVTLSLSTRMASDGQLPLTL